MSLELCFIAAVHIDVDAGGVGQRDPGTPQRARAHAHAHALEEFRQGVPRGSSMVHSAHCTHSNGFLSTLTTDAAGQLDILWHDSHTLGVDGAQVGVLEQTH